MSYCVNCGTKTAENAKFCQKCGHPVAARNSGEQDRQEYAGKLYKCPQCGAVLNAFELVCPSCGHEVRGVRATSSVKELARKLEAIEARREYEKPRGAFSTIFSQQKLAKTDEQKISLIRSFPIPNTKEDLYEFLVLAGSNISIDSYDDSVAARDMRRRATSEAWKAKFDHAYRKAKIAFAGDVRWNEIQEMYDTMHSSIRKAKSRTWRQLGYIYLGLFIAIIFLIVIMKIGDAKENREIATRKEMVVEEIQEALDSKEYKHALRLADAIDYTGYSKEKEKEWDLLRVFWVEKVIEVASENGVHLTYDVPSEDVDNANKSDEERESDSTSAGGVVDGFVKGLTPGLEKAKENLDEFTDAFNEGEN